MTLHDKQSIFLLNFAKLIIWINEQGWQVTAGELLRTQAQQDIYVNEGLSKTKDSRHMVKLAGDLNLFIGGVYQQTKAPYEPLAKYWKSLHPDNVAGYDFGWDANHFEMSNK